MRRRELLLGSLSSAVAAAWSRLAGAVGIALPAPTQKLAGTAWPTDELDRIFRDLYRRLIREDAFDVAFDKALKILRACNNGEIDRDDAVARIAEVRSEALQQPPPPREISLLPADQVGVGEAMALLRRAIAGEARIDVDRPWKTVIHCYGEFQIDGWKLTAFKRSRGIKYLDRAVAPDGRIGTYDSWSAREGNPVHHLTDDEQDKLDDLIEGIDL